MNRHDTTLPLLISIQPHHHTTQLLQHIVNPLIAITILKIIIKLPVNFSITAAFQKLNIQTLTPVSNSSGARIHLPSLRKNTSNKRCMDSRYPNNLQSHSDHCPTSPTLSKGNSLSPRLLHSLVPSICRTKSPPITPNPNKPQCRPIYRLSTRNRRSTVSASKRSQSSSTASTE